MNFHFLSVLITSPCKIFYLKNLYIYICFTRVRVELCKYNNNKNLILFSLNHNDFINLQSHF